MEARVPFLDKKFLDVAMRINPQDKMCGNSKMEKHILRECFESYLPASVARRQKEQFSDGVGYSWIDTLKEVAAQQVSDQQLETARFRFPYNTPTSKEAYLYREIFEELFPLPSAAECVLAVLPSRVLPLKRLSGMRRSRKWTIRLVVRLAFTSRRISKKCETAPVKSGLFQLLRCLLILICSKEMFRVCHITV